MCLYILAPLLATTLCNTPTGPTDELPQDAYAELQVLDELPVQLPDPVSLTGIARRVAYCESGLRNVKNPDSSASGYFQFIDSTWFSVTETRPPAQDYSLSEQTAAFYELWDGGLGASHWQPSRHCWKHDRPWEHYDR